MNIVKLAHDFADIWIAAEYQQGCNYYYGGTRMAPPQATDEEVEQDIKRLAIAESALKNRLINLALTANIFQHYEDRLPQGFTESVVGGARCIIRPRDLATYTILSHAGHEQFREVILPIFSSVGEYLNQVEGVIKLTPDFGCFAGLADILAEFTPHTLGIGCEKGGCGGKSSYSVTGILSALQSTGAIESRDEAITLIGSAGAMGSDVLAFFQREAFHDVAICDLAYEHEASQPAPETGRVLPAVARKFTEECLQRGGTIVATTLGRELENSSWWLIPSGTTFFLAHNLAIPNGEKGLTLMRQLVKQGVTVFPGQILTLGGALTSRLEWFWRQSKPNTSFDKQLAHLVVKDAVHFLITENQRIADQEDLSPYEAMFLYAGDQFH